MWIDVGYTHSKLARSSDEERAWLGDYLSFTDSAARYRKGRTRSADGKVHMLNAFNMQFPSGYLPLVLKAAPEEGYSVEVGDSRVCPCPRDPDADLDWLRDYQLAGVTKAIDRTRGILWCPTGSGKTEIAVGLAQALPCRWLFLVHRASLMEQTAERYERRTGLQAGRIGDGLWNVPEDSRFVVATFQSIAARLKHHAAGPNVYKEAAVRLLARSEGLIVDECFPAGTMVGAQRIEDVHEGDVVPSFDTHGMLVHKRVTRLWRRKPSALVRVHFVDGRSVCCTPNHKFWTRDGWVAAGELQRGLDVLSLPNADNTVLSVWHPSATNNDASQPDGVLRHVPQGTETGKLQDGSSDLRDVRSRSAPERPARVGTGEAAANVLRERVQSASVVEVIEGDGSTRCEQAQRTHDQGEPNEAGEHESKAQCNASTNRAPTSVDGRQGTWVDEAASSNASTTTGRGGRLDGGVRSADREDFRLAEERLHRHCQSNEAGSDRSGRRDALLAEGEGCGCAQGAVPSWVGVDRVEVLESGSDGTFGGMCPDGFVYNLEVEGTHAYFANGVGVSNCHVLPAWSFWNVSMACPAYFRFGLSGTPLARGDQRSIFAIAALGPVIYRIRPDTLIEAGVLAKPHIKMVEVHHGRSDKPTWQGVYGENIVRSNRRNIAVIEAVKKAEKPCFVFVKEIRHGKELERRLWQAGIKPAFVWGTHGVEARLRHVRDLVSGRIDVLVCSVVFQEGIDVPELRSVVVASGGKSVIAALQKLGRGMRPDAKTGKTEFDCWDFYDTGCGCVKSKEKDEDGVHHTHSGCRWLERHSKARLRAYTQEGYETVIESIVTP